MQTESKSQLRQYDITGNMGRSHGWVTGHISGLQATWADHRSHGWVTGDMVGSQGQVIGQIGRSKVMGQSGGAYTVRCYREMKNCKFLEKSLGEQTERVLTTRQI